MTVSPFRVRRLVLAAALVAAPTLLPAADLVQAYDLARQSDPQLQFVDAQRLATREGVPQARAALLPQIEASASLTDTDTDSTRIGERPNPDGTVGFGPTTSTSDTRSRRYAAQLNQSIYNHSNYTRLRASRARAAQADADYEAAADALALRVAEAYFNVLTAIDTLVFARAEERAVGRQLDQADQRFEVGLTAITDVHEAQARFDAARANAIASEVALDDAREVLAEITGRFLTNLRGLGDTFDPAMPEPADIARWVDTALAQNPALRSRELAVEAAGHTIATERAGHLPYLSGFASYSDNASWGVFESNGLTFPANSSSDGPTFGVTLTVPIFSGGLTSSRVRQAVHLRDASEDQLEQERRAVARNTRMAYRALLAGISEIEARRQALVSAQSALEATEAGFEVGTRTIVDVLLSQQVLFQAQRDFSRARHNFLVNQLRLRQSAGTIERKDVAEVNRHLVSDAEAQLDRDAEPPPE